MKERPILFSGPMVRAILDGRKTVTRRVVKGGQIPTENPAEEGRHRWMAIAQNHPRYGFGVFGETEEECARELEKYAPCPYGKRGERLWVRESWRVGKPHDKTKPVDILPSVVARGQGVTVLYDAGGWKSVGPAGREEPIYPDDAAMPDWAGKGRPSIHMPRDFCRILLEITDVRVERLNDITWEQAVAEGISMDGEGLFHVEESRHLAADPRDSFQSLWESINGDGSWAANPWCWAVSFKRVEVANADQ